MNTETDADFCAQLRDAFLADAQEVIEEVMALVRNCDTPKLQAHTLPVLKAVLEHLRAHLLYGEDGA